MNSTPIHLRAVLVGATAWLVSVALLHWLPLRLDPELTPKMAALAFANSAFFAGLTYLLVRHRPVPQRFPTTAAIVMPVAFGDDRGQPQ